MSEAANTPAFEEVEPEAPPPPIDTLRGMLADAAVRNYLYAGLAALVMVFLIMLAGSSDIGGLILLTLGTAGLIFRWPAVPSFFLLFLLYFLVFPFGLPPAYEDYDALQGGHLGVADVLLAFCVVVYLASHYRVYALTAQALPNEPTMSRRRRKPVKRPTDLIRPGEIPRLLYIALGVTIVGQILWLITTSVGIDVNADFPFHYSDPREMELFSRRSRPLPYWLVRSFLLFGIGFFGVLLARLVFGYWRLRTQSAAEGALVLQEASWSETHRERVRIELWQKWQAERNKKAAEKEKS